MFCLLILVPFRCCHFNSFCFFGLAVTSPSYEHTFPIFLREMAEPIFISTNALILTNFALLVKIIDAQFKHNKIFHKYNYSRIARSEGDGKTE